MSHERQKKEAQIRRRWFISTRMYIGKCDILVVARKAEKWGPNSPPLIYFHAHVYWKMWLLSCRTKIRKKRPKFAADDLFPRTSIEKWFSKAVFTNFAATRLNKTAVIKMHAGYEKDLFTVYAYSSSGFESSPVKNSCLQAFQPLPKTCQYSIS